MRILFLFLFFSQYMASQSIKNFQQFDPDEIAYKAAIVYKDGKAGLMRIDGTLIVPCIHKQIQYSSDGYFSAGKYTDNGALKFGFYNLDGSLCIPFDYDQASYFRHGLAPVRVAENWGFINTKGDVIIEFQYEKASHFTDGYSLVEKNGVKYFIDTLGNTVFGRDFEYAQKFRFGYARVNIDGRSTFIDTEGNDIAPKGYGVSYIYPDQQMMEITRGGKIGYSTMSGEITIPAKYEDGEGFFKDDITSVSMKTVDGVKDAFIDKMGKAITEFEYDESQAFCKNYGIVGMAENRQTGSSMKYGLISRNGKGVIPTKYDKLSTANFTQEPNFKQNNTAYYIAKLQGNYGVIDADHTIIIPFEFANIIYSKNGFFNCITHTEKVQLINHEGAEQFDSKLLSIGYGNEYYPGVFNGIDKRSKLKGMIDSSGKWIIRPTYNSIQFFKDLTDEIKI